MILISQIPSRRRHEIIDCLKGTAQLVDPVVIERCKEKFEKHDSKIEDDEGRIFVLVGPLAIASHRCTSSLGLCMSDEWLTSIGSAMKIPLVETFLEIKEGGRWDLKRGQEIEISYGKHGVENCRCQDCAEKLIDSDNLGEGTRSEIGSVKVQQVSKRVGVELPPRRSKRRRY